MEKKVKFKKDINVWYALLTLTIMISAMLYTVVKLQQPPHLPLLIGTSVAIIITMAHGYRWEEVEEMMYKGIRHALPAVVIIMLVGLIIGAWIGSGVVAAMIYYGLKLISPTYFLAVVVVICGIVSLAIGSSWSTMATVGVASMGIGMSMSLSPGMVAGAVISGSYFGDKMSPLSDTTNLASGLTNVDLFEHIRHMFYTTIPGLVISLIIFFVMGQMYGSDHLEQQKIDTIMNGIQDAFVISPWLLLIPLIVIIAVAFRVPAIPAIVLGIVLGFFT